MLAPIVRRACWRLGRVAAAAGSAVVIFACGASTATPAGQAQAQAQAKPSGSQAPSTADSQERIQFTGTYRGVMKDASGADVGLDYLRFSSDGKVMSLSSSAATDGGTDEAMLLRTGTFTATGNALTFATTSPAKTMAYAGTIRGDELVMKWRVEKENKVGSASFTFVPLAATEGAPAATSAVEPNETFKPAGTTWFCTRAREATAMSHCERTAKACQGFRKEILAKLPKDKFSDCTEQPKAACHTMIDKLAKKGIAFCYQHVSDCEVAGRQIRRNENPADFEVSDCAAW